MVKNPPTTAGDPGLIPKSGRFPWRRKWQPTPVFLPGKSHGQMRLIVLQSMALLKSQTDLVTKQQQKNVLGRGGKEGLAGALRAFV